MRDFGRQHKVLNIELLAIYTTVNLLFSTATH